MGQEKRLMMEMEEAAWEDADIIFDCPHCKRNVEATTQLPVVYEEGNEEHLPVEVSCTLCGNTYEGWVKTDWNSCVISLDGYPDNKVKAEPAQDYFPTSFQDEQDYYRWIDEQEQFDSPFYHAFLKAINDIESLATGVFDDDKSQMLARMLLSQSITALEVFLADTLISTVSNDVEVQKRLLTSSDVGIGKIQFKLADAVGIQDFAKDKLLSMLVGETFNNLKKVKKYFNVGLKIDILSDSNEAVIISDAIRLRHDCVHRNGIDRDSGKMHQIDQEKLNTLTRALTEMVSRIDESLRDTEDKDSGFWL